MVLEVPSVALVFIACSDEETDRRRARVAQLVLAGSLLLNFGTRLSETALYYGAAYFGSLIVLVTILALTGSADPPAVPVSAPA